MDLFLAGSQGTGLALAAGILAGAAGRRGAAGVLLLVAAIAGGAALYALSITAEDHPAWPGIVAGAAFAAFAYVVTRGVAEGARGREGGATSGLLIAGAAVLVAGASLLFGPLALLAFLALLWLAIARRRGAARKYEGLRTLR